MLHIEKESIKTHILKGYFGLEMERLWVLGNPPYIENEKDIPVALFEGENVSKTAYRDYLSDKYGRYKMTFSGIHVNFSFSEELLQ